MKKSPTLRELAEKAGLRIGCHPDFQPDKPDEAQTALHCREFDTAVFNCFHWNALTRGGSYDWRLPDAAAAWARTHGLRLRAHALLWYQTLPASFEACRTAREAGRLIRDHVHAVVGRYRGTVASWDVVNEAIWVGDGAADGLRRDLLHRKFGESYFEVVFEAAREADPGAELVLNEALLIHREQQAQRDAFLALTERLLGRGVPVDAAGIQSHLYWDDKLPMGDLDPEGTAALVHALGDLGLSVVLTELDVFERNLPDDGRGVDARVAEAYKEFLTPVLAERAVSEVVFWGMGDKTSWYNTYVRRVLSDRLEGCTIPLRPLLYDEAYRPKAAREAVVRALQAACATRNRTAVTSTVPA